MHDVYEHPENSHIQPADVTFGLEIVSQYAGPFILVLKMSA